MVSERESKRLKRSFVKVVDYLQSSSALVMATDVKGRLILINKVMEEATGYSQEEVKGRYVWEVFMSPIEAKLVSEVFNTFNPEDMPYGLRGQRRDQGRLDDNGGLVQQEPVRQGRQGGGVRQHRHRHHRAEPHRGGHAPQGRAFPLPHRRHHGCHRRDTG